jgi:hypothetical protein
VTGNQSELEERFASWAFSTVQRLRRTVGFGFIIFTAVSITVHLWINNTDKGLGAKPRAALAFIQAAACCLLALLTPKASISTLERRKGVNESDLATAQLACQRIQMFVVATYLAWSLYYLITGLSFSQMETVPAELPLVDRAFLVTFNTLPSVLLFWLYIELAEFTIDEPEMSRGERKIKTGVVNDPVSGGRVTFRRISSLGIFTLTINTGRAIKPISSNAAFLHIFSIGLFALIIAPVWYAFGSCNKSIIIVVDGIASCLNGVAIALVVGRLGSKKIDPGSLTLGLLYFYAVIQPTAASFYNLKNVQLLATTIALPLKTLLWLVFVWAFTTGILSEYVHDIRVLLTRQHADTQVEMQQENTF